MIMKQKAGRGKRGELQEQCVNEGWFALILFNCVQNWMETDLLHCSVSLVSQWSNFLLQAVQTGPLMSVKFAFLYKTLSPYYFWICNYMANMLVFLLMTVFTRPAFVMLLNPRLFSLLILELFLSPFNTNLVLPIENWPWLQLAEL